MAEVRRPSQRTARRTRALVIALVVTASGACSSDVESQTRLIDVACRGGGCQTSGSGKQTSGITSGSIGFRVGPGPGTVTIPIPDFSEPGDDSFEAQVLVRGNGSFKARLDQLDCGSGSGVCTSKLIDSSTQVARDEYEWLSVGIVNNANDPVFEGFRVQLEVTSDTAELQVADVRYDSFGSVRCSVRAPGRR